MTKTLNINTSLLLICLLGLFVLACYIIQVGRLSQDIYTLNDCEKRLSHLLENKGGLEISFSQANSLANIKDYLASTDFVKPERVRYIQVFEGSVARQAQ